MGDAVVRKCVHNFSRNPQPGKRRFLWRTTSSATLFTLSCVGHAFILATGRYNGAVRQQVVTFSYCTCGHTKRNKKRTVSEKMDIKIGLADTPRELAIKLPEGQEDIFATVEQAIANGQATFKLEDAKGHSYLIRTDRVVYVEQGSTTARSVGFMR